MKSPVGDFDVLLLAGSRLGAEDPVASSEHVTLKAFVNIEGEAMIDHVAKTLSETPGVRKIHIAIPEDADLQTHAPFCAQLLKKGDARIAPLAHSPTASAAALWQNLAGRKLLITTADHPLLTPAIIQDFLKDCEPGINVGLMREDTIAAAYPQARRTRLPFADGGYGGCNLFFLRGEQVGRILEHWQTIEGHRKKPLRLIMKLGFKPLYDFMRGRLTLSDALAVLSDKTGADIHAIMIDNPHAAIDVDRPEDLALVREIFAKEKAA